MPDAVSRRDREQPLALGAAWQTMALGVAGFDHCATPLIRLSHRGERPPVDIKRQSLRRDLITVQIYRLLRGGWPTPTTHRFG